MGIISDFKRLFWVKKAVAKSAAEKVAEEGREFVEDFKNKSSDTGPKNKPEAEETIKAWEEAKHRPADTWHKKDDWAPENQKKNPVDEESAAHKLGEKVGEAAAKTWDKAKEEGKELIDKAVKTSDKVWEKAEEVSEDVWNKAKDVAQKAGEKFQEGVDSMLEKAKDLDKKIEEERDKVDPNRDGWADKPVSEKLREHESTLKDKDDFFEKAKRFADGDYSMGKPVVTKRDEDETTDEGMTPLPPLPKEDIVDDAILDDDEDKDK